MQSGFTASEIVKQYIMRSAHALCASIMRLARRTESHAAARLLFGFLVQRMLPAEPAVLLDFHSLGMVLLLLGSIVVTLLALGAGQCDFCTHFATSTCSLDSPSYFARLKKF